MSIREIHEAVKDWSRRGEPWGEAILLAVRRSAPRPPGARYAAAADGTFAGNISAGCVEADLHEHIIALLGEGRSPGARMVTYGISDEAAAGVGLSCGGEIDVLIRAHEAGDRAWPDLLDRLARTPDGAFRAALVTAVSGERPGIQVLVDGDGVTTGDPGAEELAAVVADEVPLLFAREGSETIEMAGVGTVFVDRLLPARRLVLVGATAVGSALAEMAPALGYRVIVVDPREALIQAAGLPQADIRIGWPDTVLPALPLDEWTDVAVLAHEERLDVPALRAALEAGCRYIGLLGGRRTQRARREALVAEGVSEAEVERIRGPIGLDLGAVTPAEIAVSILAELLAVRRLGADEA